jgi:hypothetical protein
MDFNVQRQDPKTKEAWPGIGIRMKEGKIKDKFFG